MKCRNQNRPSPFPGWRSKESKEATKPGSGFWLFYAVVYFVKDACLLCYLIHWRWWEVMFLPTWVWR